MSRGSVKLNSGSVVVVVGGTSTAGVAGHGVWAVNCGAEPVRNVKVSGVGLGLSNRAARKRIGSGLHALTARESVVVVVEVE